MAHLRWDDRPSLTRPVMITSFEGWSDAADAASTATGYLAGLWEARPFATIDPEDFYDFTAVRPRARLDDTDTRVIDWPANDFSAAAAADTGRDVVFLRGVEPGLRWRTFCGEILGVIRDLGVETVISLGALAAGVAHSRPVPVMGTTADADLATRWALGRSRYEGPTGIVGVLGTRLAEEGVPTASLWAAMPHYVAQTPSPKGTLALVRALSRLLDVAPDVTDLEIATAAYERQVNDIVTGDGDIAEYVQRLEEAADNGDLDDEATLPEIPSGDSIAADAERFLREQRGGHD